MVVMSLFIKLFKKRRIKNKNYICVYICVFYVFYINYINFVMLDRIWKLEFKEMIIRVFMGGGEVGTWFLFKDF